MKYVKTDAAGIITAVWEMPTETDEPTPAPTGFQLLGIADAEVGDVFRNGVWLRGTPEIASAYARAERDRLLNMSDWTDLRSTPDAVYDKWKDYRQALRDVPAQDGFPADVRWPDTPNYQGE